MTAASRRPAEPAAIDCRTCGACCSYSAEWPRLSLETEADLERIPGAYVDDEHGRMRCSGDRCSALMGEVGVGTACAVYRMRPQFVALACPATTPARWRGGGLICT